MCALPNPPTSPNASKLFASVYDVSGTNTAAPAKSVKQTTVNSEVLGHMGVGTHKDTDTYATGDAVVLAAGINGTDILPVAVNADGEIGIHDGGNSITVDGTISVSGTVTTSISGTPNVAVTSLPATPAGTNNIGDVDVLTIAAGTNTIGGVLDSGWNRSGLPEQRGYAEDQTGTSVVELLASDAQAYAIHTIWWSIFTGTAAPAAATTLKFRFAAGGTKFHTVYIPNTSQTCISDSISFKVPIKTGTTNNVDVILAAALGTGGKFSAGVTGHKV